MFNALKYIILCAMLVLQACFTVAQVCAKDSNFYSITYTGTESNYIDDAIVTSDNEIISLGRYSVFGSFISKFTAQGSSIWSNEYQPDYPRVNWLQYPWYNSTSMRGMIASSNASFYVYGSSYEHGKSLNNVEDPPSHWVGALMHIDKFGNVIAGKYFGNWRTDYIVSNVIEISNGNLIVFLSAVADPSISKILCVDDQANIIWGAPLQTLPLYKELPELKHAITQLKNGNIVVAREMQRDIADTIFYPFTPPIILPAPLHYFHLFELDGKTGKLQWETSYQCPTLTNTNVSNTFIPEIKDLVQLPNGDLSLLADMYLPIDNERFYAHKLYSRRAINFIADKDGFIKKLIAYRPDKSSGSLESVQHTGSNGERLLLVRDTTSQQLLAFKIDIAGQITWQRSFANAVPSDKARTIALEKQNGQGLFIFQSDQHNTFNFHGSITNFIGNNPCSQIAVNAVAENSLWEWLVEKVHLKDLVLNVDFRYSNFIFKKNSYPISQNTDCEYQYVCCKDFIDSLHPKSIAICHGETYTLPDNHTVKDSGLYYATFKTTRGCDSILFYNVGILRSPADLITSPDTCLNNASSIQLRASEGYDLYYWNNVPLTDPLYTVHNTGAYTVKVQNKCGTATDTIMVYDKCDFPVYFPNAFTPNKDYLNDILKVPRQNNNRLVRLRIFNRYGQLIFETSNINEGWDGTYKGIDQPNGVYAYYLEMQGLQGKQISQKGTVVLIR